MTWFELCQGKHEKHIHVFEVYFSFYFVINKGDNILRNTAFFSL